MKNFLITIGCILTLSQIVFAEEVTCANGAGTIIIGKNKTQYCMSKRSLNWWTALGWCQSIGKQLISYPNACSCPESICPEILSNCPNLTGVADTIVWTSTLNGPKSAILISLSIGQIIAERNNFPRDYAIGKALCH